jgi:hypothetical protein
MSCFDLAEQRKHLTVLFSLANLFQLPNPLLESSVLHNGTGELVSLRKLFKLSLTQRLPSRPLRAVPDLDRTIDRRNFCVSSHAVL